MPTPGLTRQVSFLVQLLPSSHGIPALCGTYWQAPDPVQLSVVHELPSSQT